jgi:hypothetical protein
MARRPLFGGTNKAAEKSTKIWFELCPIGLNRPCRSNSSMGAAALFARLPIVALLFVSALAEPGTAAQKPKAGPSPSSHPCPKGDALFTHPPTQLGALSAIVPLGNLNPAGHTLPSRHVYAYPKMTTPGDASTAVTVPVRAPGRLEIVAVEFHPGAPDWSLHLKPCKDISLYFFHVQTLAPEGRSRRRQCRRRRRQDCGFHGQARHNRGDAGPAARPRKDLRHRSPGFSQGAAAIRQSGALRGGFSEAVRRIPGPCRGPDRASGCETDRAASAL